MALGHSPRMVMDGLVLCLDGANTKSFKGEVTTNIVPNANVMSGWSPYSSGNDGTFTTEFGTIGYRIINRPSWNGIYQGITLPSTGTYTLSAWFRYWGGSADNNGATVYTSGGGISDTAVTLDKSKVGVWQRVTMTRTYSTTSFGFYLISYGGTNAVSTWDVTMPQIEAKTYATTFTTGTRGATVATGGGWANLISSSNNGELINGVRESSDNLGSLLFDGTNDYVSVPVANNPTQQITLESWINPNRVPSTGTIRGAAISGDPNHYLGIINSIDGGATHSLHFALQTSSTRPGSQVGNIPRNVWSHIVGTYDGARMKAYLNGVMVYDVALTGTISGSGNWVVGCYYPAPTDGTHNFDGKISNAKIYNRALTAAEVKQNFDAHKGRYGL